MPPSRPYHTSANSSFVLLSRAGLTSSVCSHSGSRWHQGSSPDVWQRHCPPLQARGDAHFPLSRRLADTFPVEGRGPERISSSDLLCYKARAKNKPGRELPVAQSADRLNGKAGVNLFASQSTSLS